MRDLFDHSPIDEDAAPPPAESPRPSRLPSPDFTLWLDADPVRYREARAVVAAGVEALEAGRRDVLVLYDGGIVATAPQLRDAATDRAARVELEQDLELLRRETRRQAALSTDELLEEIRPQIRRILLLEGSA